MSTSRKLTDELDAALEHGVDVKGRRIFLHGDVEEENIAVAIRGMYLLADLSADPIELFIASYGGLVDDAFALHDVTRTIKVPVHTVALGKCQSAAPLLVACGHRGERYGSENCEFMVHDASIEIKEDHSPAQLAAYAEVIKARVARMDRLLAKYTKMPYRHWSRLSKSKTDHYFSADEALKWGLIDQIWSEKD